jgi:large subunit ribosomal protein L37Ae
MGRTKKIGPAGGLGARYGATVRRRYIDVAREVKRRHRCPQCNGPTVKRKSVGIWKCGRCSFTFTGGAYTPMTKLGATAKRVARGSSKEIDGNQRIV